MSLKCFHLKFQLDISTNPIATSSLQVLLHGKENLNAARSIIVLPKSPLPTTSCRASIKSEVCTPRAETSTNATEPSAGSSSSKGLTPIQSPEPNPCEIRISSVASMTSVIRLASPKKLSTPETSPTTPRQLARAPFSKQPKKIVVKFKKPFVPVVEEDANLQPPEKLNPSSSHDTLAKTEETDCPTEPQTMCNNNNNNADEQPTDQPNHPFSPLRQTYTPPPPIYSLISKTNRDADDTNADESGPSVVDLCTKESMTKSMNVDITGESDDDESLQRPLNEKEATNNFDVGVDDCMVDSHKCDKEIFTIEFKDDVTDANGSSSVKIDIVQIKIDRDALQVEPKPIYLEESILPDCKDAIAPAESSHTDLSSTSSHPTTSSQTQNNFNEAGPSRIDYGLSSFEDFYSSVRLSPISFAQENYAWNQRFSPQYVPFDNEKNSYMDLDVYKNANSYEERAPSTDSLNIRTDEKMPAKGEISEQESNGDVEGSSWSHQVNRIQSHQLLCRAH